MALKPFRSQRQPNLIPHRITTGLLATIVFLVPLFFLPGLTDAVELPKAAFFLFLTLLATASWTWGWVSSGELRWRQVPGRWLLAAFAIVVVLSGIFSVNRVASLLGTAGYVNHAVPVLLAAVLFAFLLTQVISEEREATQFVWALASSLGVAGLIGVLQLAGISPLPWAALRSQTFIVIGNSSVGLAVFMAVLASFVIGVAGAVRSVLWRVLCFVGLAIAVLLLLAIDSVAAWVALAVAVTIALAFSTLRQFSRYELVVSVAAVAIAVIGLFFQTGGMFGTRVNSDIRLDARTSWDVTKSTLGRYPVVGSGPSTFFYDFSRFRPASFNTSPLASFRFLKASDESLQLLSTLGILGALALLAFVAFIVAAVAGRSEQIAKRLRGSWHSMSSLFGAWCGLTAALFFTPATMATTVSFWTMAALLLAMVRPVTDTHVVGRPMTRLWGTLAFVATVIVLIVTTVWSVRLLLADHSITIVTAGARKNQDPTTLVPHADAALRYNPSSAAAYLLRAQLQVVVGQAMVQQQRIDQQGLARMLSTAAAYGETAVSRDPDNPTVLEALAGLYKNIGSVVGDTGSQVISAYERAVAAEPNSDQQHVNLGQVYYLTANSLAEQKDRQQGDVTVRITEARAELNKALNLNPQNVDAAFGLTLVDELSGEKDRAFENLQSLVAAHPDLTGLRYELGVRYLDRKDTVPAYAGKAKEAFIAVIEQQPSFTQAHWQLGLIAEQEKDTATARREFELVQQLDPSNTEVRSKLEALPKP